MGVADQESVRPVADGGSSLPMGSPAPVVDWLALVDHATRVAADERLEDVQHRFQCNKLRYMAVVDESGRALGLCASRQIGLKLGAQYGFALFGREPIRACLVPEPLFIRLGQTWSEVLDRVFSRTRDEFNEDALLVDDRGGFLGLISAQTLVRWQTRLLAESIARLEEQQAEITRRNRQMTEDLLMAREMQMAMLPRGLPDAPSGVVPGRGALRILSHYAPLALVSGDFYEVLALSESTIGLFIADVMGHGVQAALVTAMMRALIQDHGRLAGDPGAFLTALNRSLAVILAGCRLPTFASAFALTADAATGVLGFANAGHPGPILLRRTTREVLSVAGEPHCNGGLLGICSDTRYTTGNMTLAAGDRVLLFTDGLFEIEGPDGEMLGPEGLRGLAAPLMDHPAESFAGALVEAARRCSVRGRFEDDVCLIGLEVERLPSGAAAA